VIACRATIYPGASRPCVAGTLIRISLNALIVFFFICFRGRAAGGRRGHRVAQRRRRPPALRRLQLLGRAADADAVDGLGRSRLHPQPPPVPRLQDAAIPHGQFIFIYVLKNLCIINLVCVALLGEAQALYLHYVCAYFGTTRC
jgi:hypothetical protein